MTPGAGFRSASTFAVHFCSLQPSTFENDATETTLTTRRCGSCGRGSWSKRSRGKRARRCRGCWSVPQVQAVQPCRFPAPHQGISASMRTDSPPKAPSIQAFQSITADPTPLHTKTILGHCSCASVAFTQGHGIKSNRHLPHGCGAESEGAERSCGWKI